MTIEANTIVAVNAGSSSIKVTAFVNERSMVTLSRLVDLSINNIGQPTSILQILRPNSPMKTEAVEVPDHATGARLIMDYLAKFVAMDEVVAIGHRLVHGGMVYTNPVPINKISDMDWRSFAELDPEHAPAARQLVAQFTQALPSVFQVACFDTAFFQDLPQVAKIIPIPKKYYELGVRRYGFHGLSYTSLLETFREKAGDVAANGRVILVHLGSGASMTAIRLGKPVDTTMGFTPNSGLVMSTRSGDLDPNIVNFLHQQSGMSLEQFEQMASAKSGLLGVSGISGDMQKLLNMEDENNDAKLAIELFVHSVKKSIGALSAVLGGVDSIIFSGGIGEQSSVLRARICEGLEFLGIEVGNAMNEQHDFLISSGHSRVGVHVIPTDEAQVIAKQTIKLVSTSGRA